MIRPGYNDPWYAGEIPPACLFYEKGISVPTDRICTICVVPKIKYKA